MDHCFARRDPASGDRYRADNRHGVHEQKQKALLSPPSCFLSSKFFRLIICPFVSLEKTSLVSSCRVTRFLCTTLSFKHSVQLHSLS